VEKFNNIHGPGRIHVEKCCINRVGLLWKVMDVTLRNGDNRKSFKEEGNMIRGRFWH
jgi:hypothetical protein